MKVGLLDVPFLIVIGGICAYLYAKHLIKRNKDWYVFLILFFTVIFWLDIILSNSGVIPKPWFGILGSVNLHPLIGTFYVLSYPLWFSWGAERVFQIFGRSPEEEGVLWPFTLKERGEPFKPSWKS